MESAQETLAGIASVSQGLINTVTSVGLGREGGELAEISRIRLAGDLHKIVATSLAIVETLNESSDCRDDILDERLNDWLMSREPAMCQNTLDAMSKLLRASVDKGAWKWLAMLPLAPSKDNMKEVITLFAERKDNFHFLLTTDVWNRDKHDRRELGTSVLANSNDLAVDKTDATLPRFHAQFSREVPVGIDTIMHEVVGKPKEKRKEFDCVFFEIAQINLDENAISEGKKLDNVLQWLDGLDCTEKHESTLDLRQSDTCTWLPDTYAYKAWRHGEYSFLWLHGKPGAGKTVLAASVIETLERSLEDGEFLAFFYCDFRTERSMNAAEVMRSLLSQLMHKFLDGGVDPGDVLDELIKEKGRRSILNNAKHLSRLISSAAKQFTRKPLIIIDALDECGDIQTLLDALSALSQGRLQLFVTSRPVQAIKDQFADFPSLSLEKMSSAVSADIQLHVIRELDLDRRLRIAPAGLKEEIRAALCENADGMFRWVQCQLETLKRCMTPTDIREALDSLPNGLEETYRRILTTIDKEKREAEVAQRALTWLIATFSPLRLSQIIEALSIDLDRRILDPDLAPIHGSALLDALSSLVTHNEETDVVILSHFSVKEYLTEGLAHAKLPGYHFNPQYSEGQLARFCMCYIAACLNQAQGFGSDGSISHVAHESKVDPDYEEPSQPVGHHAAGHPSPEFRPLLEYVLSHAFDHLAHVVSGSSIVLKTLRDLEADVQRNPLEWERIRKGRRSRPAWPTSEDDFVLYILISFAPEPLLRSFLGRSRVKPRAGTNPLVYAAQLDRVEHVETLLSRGAALNSSGLWHSSQVMPLAVAVQCNSSAVVDLFLMKGSLIPRRVFMDIAKTEYLTYAPRGRIAARLLQTDDFAEWALEVQDEFPLASFFGPFDGAWTRQESVGKPNDEDVVTIIRRLVQVDCELFAHNAIGQKLFRRAAAVGHTLTLKYLFSTGIPPPPDALLDVSRSTDPSATTMRFLLDNGVDLYSVTDYAETALHVALDCNISEDECLERVRLLVNAGCDPSAYSLYGETPFHLAVERGFISIVKYLLSLGVLWPPDILLSISKKRSSKKVSMVIRYLICIGVDVHVVTANGDTMLHTILDYSIADHQEAEEDCLESTKIFTEAGCSPSIANSVGDTPMDVAVQNGHVSVVEYFLALNIPLPPDALLRAAPRRSPQMINLLLKKGANVGAVSADGNNALHLALETYVQLHMESTVKILVEAGCNPGAHNVAGQTPLHLSVRYEQKSIITYFLSQGVPLPRDIMLVSTTGELYILLAEQGADLFVVAKNGDTVLHGIMDRVFPERDALKLTKMLVRAGCNPSVLNAAGETPLQIAVRRGYVSIIEYLLAVNISLPSDILLTASHPLSSPQSNCRVQTIRFLVEKGAATNVVARDGDSALHLALSSHFVKEDDVLKAAKILIGAGCEPWAQNLTGETALHAAAKGGHLTAMEYLISQGIPLDPNILLCQATSTWPNSKSTIMRFLISKGADIHAVTANGDTALHLTLACSYPITRLETAQILIASGCNSSQSNLAGEMPLHVAARSGFPSLVRYIRSQNAPLPSDILLAAAAALGKAHLRGQTPHITPMFRLLIREGASVSVTAPNGDTLLHIAIRQGPHTHLNTVIRRDPESLHMHSNFSPWKLIGILLSAGCDPFFRNVDGQTSFDLAKEQGRHFHSNFLRLVSAHRGSVQSGPHPQTSSSKRRGEEMSQDMVGRLTKRGRLDDVGDEDEIAEVDEQLMM